MSTMNKVLTQALKIKRVSLVTKHCKQRQQTSHGNTQRSSCQLFREWACFTPFETSLELLASSFWMQDCVIWWLNPIIAEGSVDRVLNGKQYDRGLRLHKLLCKALKRLTSFKDIFISPSLFLIYN